MRWGGLGWGGGLGWVELCLIAACGNTVHNPKPKAGPNDVAELAGGSGGQTAPGGVGGAVASAGEAPSEGGLSGAGGAEDEAGVLITGRVVSLTEHPLADVVVEVDGDRLVTAADGRFRTRAELPYDVVVHHVVKSEYEGAEPLLLSDVYLGVTRQDLKLYGHQNSDRSCALRGSITGGATYPVVEEHRTHMLLLGPQVLVAPLETQHNSFAVFQPPGSGGDYFTSYEWDRPTWGGAETAEATLFALQRNVVTGAIVGVGSKSVTLVHDAIVGSPSADIQLRPPQYRDLVINVTAAEPPIHSTVHSSSATFHYISEKTDFSAFPHTVQALTGIPAEVGFELWATGVFTGGKIFNTRRWVSGDATSLDLHLGAPPSIQSPDRVVYDQPRSSVFRFTPAPNAVTAVLLCDQDTQELPRYCVNVFTNDAHLELQRILDLGLEHAVPPRTLIRWDVVSRAEADSVDAFLDPSRSARAWFSSVSGTLESEVTGRIFFYE